MTNLLHKISPKHTRIIAAVLSLVLVLGAVSFIAPVEAQALAINASDSGFYNVAYGTKGETTFGDGTRIRVINQTRANKSKSEAVYTLGTTGWDADNTLVWDGTGENTIYGIYPYNASYDKFTIPAEQSGGVQDADWMTATYTGAKPSNKSVALHFNHLLTKVTIKVNAWGGEYGDTTKAITEAKIYSLATDIKKDDSGAATANTANLTAITPLYDETEKTYTAIICPGAYTKEQQIMSLTVNGTDSLTVLANANESLTTEGGLKPGYHYTFELTVGKNAVELTTVTVSDWKDGGKIDGGVATVEETLKNCNMGNHIGTLVFTSTNDGTQHTATYSCCGTTVTENHSENTTIGQTCLGYKCAVCGAWYGTKDATNHAKELTYTPNDDGATHTKAYPCCSTVVDAEEDHTMDATTGKCVCGLQMAEVSITRGETVTYYPYASEILGEGASVLQSGDIVQLLADAYGAVIPEGVTFNGGNFTLSYSNVLLKNNGTITGGTFTTLSGHSMINNGTIKGGTFTNNTGADVTNYGTIEGGTFNSNVSNSDTITGGTFNGSVSNSGTITGGNFDSVTISDEDSSISGNLTIRSRLTFDFMFYPSDFDPSMGEGEGIFDLSNATLGGGTNGDDAIGLYYHSSEEWNWNNEDENVVKLKLPEGYCVFYLWDTYTETLTSGRSYDIIKHSHEFDTTGVCECGAKL